MPVNKLELRYLESKKRGWLVENVSKRYNERVDRKGIRLEKAIQVAIHDYR